jgi:hypothetical protein
MPVWEVALSTRVFARNRIGQFTDECSAAGEATVSDMIDEGADLSRSLAPVGHKLDKRDVPLKESIESEMLSRTSGIWYSISGHALPIETGARAHPIPGKPGLRFWWDKEGRMFLPAPHGRVTVVQHPGNAAQPFLRPAYEAIMSRWSAIAKRYYPS